jgi:hypothetical protein
MIVNRNKPYKIMNNNGKMSITINSMCSEPGKRYYEKVYDDGRILLIPINLIKEYEG